MYKSKRVVAKLIDIGFVILVLLIIQYVLKQFDSINLISINYAPLFLMFGLLFLYVYFGYFSYNFNYSTLGKKIVGLKIVRANNEAPKQNELFFREPLCICFVIFSIIYAAALIISPSSASSSSLLFTYLLLIISFEFLIFMAAFIFNLEFWNKKHKIVGTNSPCHIPPEDQ